MKYIYPAHLVEELEGIAKEKRDRNRWTFKDGKLVPVGKVANENTTH